MEHIDTHTYMQWWTEEWAWESKKKQTRKFTLSLRRANPNKQPTLTRASKSKHSVHTHTHTHTHIKICTHTTYCGQRQCLHSAPGYDETNLVCTVERLAQWRAEKERDQTARCLQIDSYLQTGRQRHVIAPSDATWSHTYSRSDQGTLVDEAYACSLAAFVFRKGNWIFHKDLQNCSFPKHIFPSYLPQKQIILSKAARNI